MYKESRELLHTLRWLLIMIDDKTLLLSSQATLTTLKGHKLKLIGAVSGYVDQKEYCYMLE